MTPTNAISAPMHPWAKVAMPVAIAAIGGATAYGLLRATDDERSTTDRVLSGALGVGVAAGAALIGGKVSISGYAIKDAAMAAVRKGGSYADHPWPKGTAVVTRGNGTWYIPPQIGIGDSLEVGGLAGGILGGLGGGIVGLTIHDRD